MSKEEKKYLFQDIIIYYFICSVIGWILEMIYGLMVFGHFVDRGFLYGPMCPIYGCGAVTMVLITEGLRKKELNVTWKFLIIMLVFSTIEYISSWLLEVIFGLRWWDYTNEFLNINGRVCLIFSLMFGFMGIIFTEFIYQPSKKMIEEIRNKVSTKVIWIILMILVVVWLVDEVFSVIRYIN